MYVQLYGYKMWNSLLTEYSNRCIFTDPVTNILCYSFFLNSQSVYLRNEHFCNFNKFEMYHEVGVLIVMLRKSDTLVLASQTILNKIFRLFYWFRRNVGIILPNYLSVTSVTSRDVIKPRKRIL